MKHRRNIIIGVLFTILPISSNIFAQDVIFQGSPPSTKAPSAEKKALIDSLVTASKFDLYFKEYASDQILAMSYKNKWTEEEVAERKSRIDVTKFLQFSVYNELSFLTDEEIYELITVMSKLNKKRERSYYAFTSSVIESNMKSFVELRYLK